MLQLYVCWKSQSMTAIATLIPTVQQYVRRGTTIYTDLWRAYDSLDWCGYVHGTVKHSQYFVDPVHTNLIEGMWTHAKKFKNHSTSEDLFGSYLVEYMCRRKETPFTHLINHMTVINPVYALFTCKYLFIYLYVCSSLYSPIEWLTHSLIYSISLSIVNRPTFSYLVTYLHSGHFQNL